MKLNCERIGQTGLNGWQALPLVAVADGALVHKVVEGRTQLSTLKLRINAYAIRASHEDMFDALPTHAIGLTVICDLKK